VVGSRVTFTYFKCLFWHFSGWIKEYHEIIQSLQFAYQPIFSTSDLEDQGIDGKIILKLILNKWDGVMDRIDLAQVRFRWRAVVNAAMNLRVP
jgi:hypothetical protein